MSIRFSIILVSALYGTASFGSVESFLKDSVVVTGGSAGYTTTQTRGVFSLGEMRVSNSDIGTIGMPIQFTAPKIKAGCGGIDATLGGFQFLLDEMVEKLKKIAAAAPAFAFQIALNFLCPECAQMMAQLEALANKLNSMNMDGCTAMQGLANWTSKQLETTEAYKAMKGGAVNTFASEVTSWAKSPTNIVNKLSSGLTDFQNNYVSQGASADDAKKAAENSMWTGSLIIKAMKENPNMGAIFGTKGDSESIIRAIAGDIIRQPSKDTPRLVTPEFSESDLKILINGNGNIKGIEVSVDAAGNITSAPKTVNITITKGMKQHFKEQLTTILNKMVNSINTNTPFAISGDEKEFLNAMPLPVYKILNTEAKKGLAAVGSDSLDSLANTLAAIQAELILGQMMGKIYFTIAEYNNKYATDIDLETKEIPGANAISERTLKNIQTMKNTLYAELKVNQDKFQQQVKLLEYYSNLDKELGAKLATNGIYSRKQLMGY